MALSESLGLRLAGVFYCGPSGLARELEELCTKFSTKTITRFVFHKEHYWQSLLSLFCHELGDLDGFGYSYFTRRRRGIAENKVFGLLARTDEKWVFPVHYRREIQFLTVPYCFWLKAVLLRKHVQKTTAWMEIPLFNLSPKVKADQHMAGGRAQIRCRADPAAIETMYAKLCARTSQAR